MLNKNNILRKLQLQEIEKKIKKYDISEKKAFEIHNLNPKKIVRTFLSKNARHPVRT